MPNEIEIEFLKRRIKLSDIMYQIKKGCIQNNGMDFTIEKFCCIRWYETPHLLPFLPPQRYDEEKLEFENILSALPNEIQHSQNTTKLKLFSDKDTTTYDTEYTLHISKDYSNKIFNVARRKRIIFTEEFTSENLSNIMEFKNNVKEKHSEIIEEYYKYLFSVWGNGNVIGNEGLIDSENQISYPFSYFGLKSLETEYQKYGLAFAIAEYGINFWDANTIFFINLSPINYQLNVDIKIVTYRAKEELKDW